MHLSDQSILLVFFILRLFSVYVVRTSFVPDEYWQSLEVSHKLAFGYGHLTWEWDKKIRSYFYPFVNYLLYKCIPDSTFYVIHSPRVLQAILSCIGDFFAYKFAAEYFGKSCGRWTVFNILTSWFLFYCSARTLTNMVEASLTSCGIYFYPFPKRRKYRLSFKYIWLAAASCIIRPTAAVMWLPLYIWHVMREKHKLLLIMNTCLVGCAVLSGMLLIDKWCYGEWVLTPYNFFLFNWSNDIGAFYGSHPFYWYFLIGLPTVLGIQIIPFMCGLLIPQLRQFYALILWVLLIFSVPSHKEFRFLLPVLHMCMIVCGVVMDEMWSGKLIWWKTKINRQIMNLFVLSLTLIHVSLSIYMGVFHQRGVIAATAYLSENVNADSRILFLMPCHSTPYYSYIHKNIEMKFLSCEPNFENDENYIEEAEEFFAHPLDRLYKNYDSKHPLAVPSHIVMFDALYPHISKFLNQHHYNKCFSAFHSHFAEGRTGSHVYIYCKY